MHFAQETFCKHDQGEVEYSYTVYMAQILRSSQFVFKWLGAVCGQGPPMQQLENQVVTRSIQWSKHGFIAENRSVQSGFIAQNSFSNFEGLGKLLKITKNAKNY